jgi:putative flippase GtrA
MKLTLAKYFLVGGTAAAVDWAIFFGAVTWLGYPWFPVAIFSFFIATLTNYVLSICFVFESRARFRRRDEIALVFMVSAAAMALNQFILWAAIDLLALNLLPSKVIGTGSVFLFNFACRHYFIFRRRPKGGTAATPP